MSKQAEHFSRSTFKRIDESFLVLLILRLLLVLWKFLSRCQTDIADFELLGGMEGNVLQYL